MFEISEQRMADQVTTIINKEWFTAEKMDEIRRREEHQKQNKDIEAALEDPDLTLENLWVCLPAVNNNLERNINNNDREAVEKMMRK